MIQIRRHPLPNLSGSRVVGNRASLRRGNILLEFISAYGLQVSLIAGALVLLASAYALIARTSTTTEIRQIVMAAQQMFGKSTGTYAGITTAIIAASAESDVLPKALVEGTGTAATLSVNGGEFPVYIKANASSGSPLTVNSTKYFIMQVGDNLRPIESVDMCSELARLQLPRLHTMQVQGPAAFVAAPATQTFRPPKAVTAVGGPDLTIGDSSAANVEEFGDDENNSRINSSCNSLASTVGSMIVYLVN